LIVNLNRDIIILVQFMTAF